MNDKWIVQYKDGTEKEIDYSNLNATIMLDADKINKAYPVKIKDKFAEEKKEEK